MRYLGLDVHYKTSTYCVLEENGKEVQGETVRGHGPQLWERLRTLRDPGRSASRPRVATAICIANCPGWRRGS